MSCSPMTSASDPGLWSASTSPRVVGIRAGGRVLPVEYRDLNDLDMAKAKCTNFFLVAFRIFQNGTLHITAINCVKILFLLWGANIFFVSLSQLYI